MKTIFKPTHSIIVLMLFVFVASCGKKKDITATEAAKNLAVSEKPDFILAVATGEVINKSGIKGDAVPLAIQMMFGEMLDYVRKEEKTGISFEGSSYILLKMGINNEPEYIVAVYNIKNPDRFKEFIKEETKLDAEKKDGINYYTEGKDFIIGWYKTFAISLMANNLSTKDAAFEKLKLFMESAINKPKEELPKNYAAFFEEKADISIIYNMDMVNKIDKVKQNEDKFKKIQEYYEGGSVIYSVNFEIDKISGKFKNLLSEKANQRFSQMFGKGISEGMTHCLTDNGKLVAFGSGAINMGSFIEFLTEMGLNEEKEVEEFEEMTRISFSDIAKAFTGEATISLIDIEQINALDYYKSRGIKIEDPTYYSYMKTMPKMAITIGLNSDLIKNVLDTTKNLKKENNVYGSGEDMFMAINGAKLIITTHKELAQKFAENGSLGPYNENNQTSQAMANAFYGYLNFEPLKKLMSEEELKTFEESFNNLSHAKFSANFNAGTFEINLKPSGKNSLGLITSIVFELMFRSMGSGLGM